jgi:hypothetical protein
MSGGAAGTSSRAPEPGDDESDRDEDQDEQTSFVCDLLAGRVWGSLRLDDDEDDEVARPDATPMSKGGTRDRFCTSCIRFVTSSSSDETSIVISSGVYGVGETRGTRLELSEMVETGGMIFLFKSQVKNCMRRLELSR